MKDTINKNDNTMKIYVYNIYIEFITINICLCYVNYFISITIMLLLLWIHHIIARYGM